MGLENRQTDTKDDITSALQGCLLAPIGLHPSAASLRDAALPQGDPEGSRSRKPAEPLEEAGHGHQRDTRPATRQGIADLELERWDGLMPVGHVGDIDIAVRSLGQTDGVLALFGVPVVDPWDRRA